MSEQELMRPRYKVIEGSFYEISDYGDVRNKKTNRILKPSQNNRGYLYVELQISGKQKRFYMHRLVAKYFVDGQEIGLVVNHKDSDKKNNHYTNLEWITVKQNCIHAHQNGMGKNGHNHYMAKLLAEDVSQIQHLNNLGASKRQISYLYGVGETLIHNVLFGKSYKRFPKKVTLLTKRFKLMINYPNSGLNIGDIVYADLGTTLYKRIQIFLGLFNPLEWWQDRKLEEMPKYVRLINEKMLESEWYDKVAIVAEWRFLCGEWVATIDNYIAGAHYYQPATEQEYTDYINSLTK